MRIQLRALVPMRRIAAAVMALASGLVIVSAQSSDTFVPVTDAMLEAPAPGDWLTWRRTPDRWATARSIRSTATTFTSSG